MTISKHTSAEAVLLFELKDDARPRELRYHPGFAGGRRIVYEFE